MTMQERVAMLLLELIAPDGGNAHSEARAQMAFRDVLDAMREPIEAMVIAGSAVEQDEPLYCVGDVAAEAVWCAMIDAALAEGASGDGS